MLEETLSTQALSSFCRSDGECRQHRYDHGIGSSIGELAAATVHPRDQSRPGVCPSAPGSSVTSSVISGAAPKYSVFVPGTGTVPFDPSNNRIIVEFKDAGGVTCGSTSVAVRTL